MVWKSAVYVIEYNDTKWITFSTAENRIWIYRRNRPMHQYDPTFSSWTRLVSAAINGLTCHDNFLDCIPMYKA